MKMIIAVDFDGTVVEHKYPEVGQELDHCVRVLQKLVSYGHKLILSTMRSEGSLMDAVVWFDERNIKLWGINNNSEQHAWTKSPKVYAHIYIGDDALGCPINIKGADWEKIEILLSQKGCWR